MGKLLKINKMILIRLKESLCKFNLDLNSHPKTMECIREMLNLRTEGPNPKIIQAREAKSQILLALKMLGHLSQKRFLPPTKTKLSSLVKRVRSLTIASLNLLLRQKLDTLQRTQIRLIKTLSLSCLILVNTEGPISSLYAMVMELMVNL